MSTITVSAPTAAALVSEYFGIAVTNLEPVGSELSSLFRADSERGRLAVKIQASDANQRPVQEWRALIADELVRRKLPVPPLHRALSGALATRVHVEGQDALLTVMAWIDAVPYSEAALPIDFGLRLGTIAGHLHLALAQLPDPPAHLSHAWDMRRTTQVLADHLSDGSSETVVEVARDALDLYSRRVAPHVDALPAALVHQDLHDSNVLVNKDGEIAAVLDFDDMLVGWRVAEPALAAGYLARNVADQAAALTQVAAGWEASVPFTEAERSVFPALAALRLAVNAVVWDARAASDRGAYAAMRSAGSAEAYLRLRPEVEST